MYIRVGDRVTNICGRCTPGGGRRVKYVVAACTWWRGKERGGVGIMWWIYVGFGTAMGIM